MTESDNYIKLKAQIKQEIFQELVEELPKIYEPFYKEIEGLDKNKNYIFKIYFKDNVDVTKLCNICDNFSKLISNLDIKGIIIPLRKYGDICDIKIEGDPNA